MIVDLSVVVAVYNEHPKNLVLLLERLYKVFSPLDISYEVVFVNDGSRAETSNALLQLANEVDKVKLVVLSRNFGQQAAISAGLDHTEGRAIVNIDSDLQDPPELIPEMLKYWRAGYDVVYAQRSSRRDRVAKRLSAYLFYRVLGAVSSIQIPWDTGDFRLMDRRVIDALNKMPEKTRFLRGQIPWLGFRQIGIPINRGAREVGESTYTLKKLIQLAMDGLLAFSSAPLMVLPGVGGVLIASSLIGLIIWALARGTMGSSGEVILIVVSACALFTGVQIVCAGMLGVYLSKVLDEVRARPTYVVSDFITPSTRNRADTRELSKSFDEVLPGGSELRLDSEERAKDPVSVK